MYFSDQPSLYKIVILQQVPYYSYNTLLLYCLARFSPCLLRVTCEWSPEETHLNAARIKKCWNKCWNKCWTFLWNKQGPTVAWKHENRCKCNGFRVSVSLMVPKTRLELAQPNGHYHLKVACIPISPLGHFLTAQIYSIFSLSQNK